MKDLVKPGQIVVVKGHTPNELYDSLLVSNRRDKYGERMAICLTSGHWAHTRLTGGWNWGVCVKQHAEIHKTK